MKAENIEQIRKIHGRILSATESIEDTVGTNLISVWRRDQIIAACEQIDECVRQLEGIMIEEEPIVVALNDFQAAFEGDQDAQARLDAAFDAAAAGKEESSNHDIINVSEHERIKQELEQPNNEV